MERRWAIETDQALGGRGPLGGDGDTSLPALYPPSVEIFAPEVFKLDVQTPPGPTMGLSWGPLPLCIGASSLYYSGPSGQQARGFPARWRGPPIGGLVRAPNIDGEVSGGVAYWMIGDAEGVISVPRCRPQPP